MDLSENEYTGKFYLTKNNFLGFEIYLSNQPVGNTGELLITVSNQKEQILDIIKVDLSKVSENVWYKFYANKPIKAGHEYNMRISARDCSTFPQLRIVDQDCLTSEMTEREGVFIGFAYSEPTFSIYEKILLCMFIVFVWLIVISFSFERGKVILNISIFGLLVAGMSWNYMFNSLDNQNTMFEGFHVGSENLVVGAITAKQNNASPSSLYGLGRYSDIMGDIDQYDSQFITDDNWENGFSRTLAAICIKTSQYSEERATISNWIKFSNGETFKITYIDIGDIYANIYLESTEILTSSKYGSLRNIVFCDENGTELPTACYQPYTSQYGLQGKVFYFILKYLIKYTLMICICYAVY